MLNATQETMKTELLIAIKENGETIDDIRDNSGEWIDSHLPIYTGDIIKEWQNMPSEYDDRGAIELGYDGDANIVKQMTLDLYLYYLDLFYEVCNEVEQELEEEQE